MGKKTIGSSKFLCPINFSAKYSDMSYRRFELSRKIFLNKAVCLSCSFLTRCLDTHPSWGEEGTDGEIKGLCWMSGRWKFGITFTFWVTAVGGEEGWGGGVFPVSCFKVICVVGVVDLRWCLPTVLENRSLSFYAEVGCSSLLLIVFGGISRPPSWVQEKYPLKSLVNVARFLHRLFWRHNIFRVRRLKLKPYIYEANFRLCIY